MQLYQNSPTRMTVIGKRNSSKPFVFRNNSRMLNSVLIDAIDCLFIHVKNHWLMGASYRLVQKDTSTILYFVIVFETVCCKYDESLNLKIPPRKK